MQAFAWPEIRSRDDGRRRADRDRRRRARRRPLRRRPRGGGARSAPPTRRSITTTRSRRCSATSSPAPIWSSSTRPTCSARTCSARLQAEIAARLRPGVRIVDAARRQGRAGGGARPRRRRRGRPRRPPLAARARRRARPRRFRQLCRGARPGRRSARRSAAGLPRRSAAHDILRVKGFVDVPGRERRQVVQAVGDRVQHYFDRAVGAGRAARHPPRRDRQEGPRPRRDRRGAAAARCISSPPSPAPSPTGRRRSISRQTPGDIVVLASADTEIALLAAAQKRAGARDPNAPTLRLAPVMRLGHNLSVDLYMETVGAGAAGRGAAARRQRAIGLTASSAWSRPAASAASRWRCCPATTSPTPSWPSARPCPPLPAGGCGAISPKAAPPMPSNFLRYAASADRRRRPTGREPAPLLRAGLYWPGMSTPSLADIAAEWRGDARDRRRSCSTARWCSRGTPRRSMRWSRRWPRARLQPLPIFVHSLKDARGRRAARPKRSPRTRRPSSSTRTGFSVAASGARRPVRAPIARCCRSCSPAATRQLARRHARARGRATWR